MDLHEATIKILHEMRNEARQAILDTQGSDREKIQGWLNEVQWATRELVKLGER